MKTQFLKAKVTNGVPEVTPQQIFENLKFVVNKQIQVIDVRRPDEFNAELGHIEGAKLATLGPQLLEVLTSIPRDAEVVFVCRSGGRSGSATIEAKSQGFSACANMVGGMLKWNELGLPVVKDE